MPGEPWTHSKGSRVCTFQREKSSLPGVGSCCFYNIRIKEKVGKSSKNGEVWGSGGHPQPGIILGEDAPGSPVLCCPTPIRGTPCVL